TGGGDLVIRAAEARPLNVRAEWREVSADVIHVHSFLPLEPADYTIGYRRQKHLPADLEDELADHHFAKSTHRPVGHSVEGQRVEDQAVGTFADHGAAPEAHPQVLAFAPDLHF